MIEKLSTHISASRQKQPAYDPLHFNVPRSISNFTGRDELLQQLVVSLDQKPCVLVISGMGGVGKTSLIRHFVNQNEVAHCNILWLATETEQDLKKSLKKAAECVAERLKGKKLKN